MTKQKVLIIDDDTDLITLLRTRLESAGYGVISANDGDVGILKVEKEKPDLVILDLRLPHLGGFWICKSLKSQDKYKNIPIIILTGVYKSEEEKKQTLKLSAEAYMEKPFEAKELLEKIRDLLGK